MDPILWSCETLVARTGLHTQSANALSDCRLDQISPNGKHIAFLDHPVRRDDAGSVAIVDLAGNKNKNLSGDWETAEDLAWAPNDEVWFSTARVGVGRFLYAVSLSGPERLLAREPGTLTLQDVGRDGRVLLTRDVLRVGMIGLAPGLHKKAIFPGSIGLRPLIYLGHISGGINLASYMANVTCLCPCRVASRR